MALDMYFPMHCYLYVLAFAEQCTLGIPSLISAQQHFGFVQAMEPRGCLPVSLKSMSIPV
jgi:hypothetical protein